MSATRGRPSLPGNGWHRIPRLPALDGLRRRTVPAWGYGGLGVLYLVLLFVLGFMSIRKGHWIMFIVGIFLPLFWVIGAVMPPVRAKA
jgi:hypothetical protein